MNETIIPLLPALYMLVGAPGVVMSNPSTVTYADFRKCTTPALSTAFIRFCARMTMGAASVATLVITGRL
jgi:hypothetical protein